MMMVPASAPVDSAIKDPLPNLEEDDLIILLLQRAEVIPQALGQIGDLAEFAVHTRGHDYRLARAGGRARSGKHQVRQLGERRAADQDGLAGRVYMLRLACEGGLIRPHLGLLHQAAIRG
jgi:hypothetical protein